jgi:hypothetical protein
MQKIILFIGLVLCFLQEGIGQNVAVDSLRNSYDQSYGLNTLLTNGKKYFPPDKPIRSHPFWKREEAFVGTITISGHTFTDQQLKYELNKQQFVLFYSNYNGQPGQIILNSLLIDSVRMENSLFIPNQNPEIHQPFVQLIRNGKLTCTIAWSKDFKLINTGQNAGYEYSQQHPLYHLNYKGSDYMFSNKSSFLRIFNQKERVFIRKYISSNHLKFNMMNDTNLRNLIIFCEQTLVD